jgi:hypothetical protein
VVVAGAVVVVVVGASVVVVGAAVVVVTSATAAVGGSSLFGITIRTIMPAAMMMPTLLSLLRRFHQLMIASLSVLCVCHIVQPHPTEGIV